MGYYLSVGVHLQISRREKDVDKGKLVVAATMFPGKRVVLIQYSETLQKGTLQEGIPKEISKSRSHSPRGDKAKIEEKRTMYVKQCHLK